MKELKERMSRFSEEETATTAPQTFLSGKQKRKLKRAFERKLEKMRK